MKVTLLTQEEMDYIDNINDPITITEIYPHLPKFRVGIRLDDNTLIGTMILFNISTENHKAEFGIHIFKLGTFLYREMLKQVVGFLDESFKQLNLNRIYARIHSDNKRSISCAKKIGFSYEGTEKQSLLVCNKYKDIVVMSLLKNEGSD